MLVLGLAALMAMPGKAQAQALIWTPGGDSGAPGGDGLWDTSGQSWWNGTFYIPWTNSAGYSAYFGGPAGTVTVDAGGIRLQDMTFATSGYVIEGGPLTLSALTPSLITTPSAGTTTINASITGNSTVVVDGGGTLTLGGANSYTDGTKIIGNSTLQISDDANLGAAGGALVMGDAVSGARIAITDPGSGAFASARAVTINSGGAAIDVASGVTATFSGVLDGSGALTFANTGTLVLAGNNTNTGILTLADAGRLVLTGDNAFSGVTIAGGTLQVGNGGAGGSFGTGDIANNGALVFNRSGSAIYSGIVSGTGSLVQAGPGTTILTGNNTYTGGTIISGGALQIGDNGNSGSITGDIANDGQLIFSRSDTYHFAGAVSGSGSLLKDADGTTILSGANSYGGGTYINGGTLQISDDGNLGAASGGLFFNGGTLQAASDVTSARDTVLAGFGGFGSVNGATLTIDGPVSGSGSFNVATGRVVLGNSANSYSGGTAITGGTLVIAGDGALGTGGLTLGGGTLQAVSSFDLDRDIATESGRWGTLAVSDGNTVTVNGNITGNGVFQASGPGTVVLAGSSTAAFSIGSGATLQVSSAANLGSGAVEFHNGTLALTAGFDVINDFALFSGGARIDVASGAVATLTGTVSGSGSPLSKNGAGTLVLAGNNIYASGTIINAGLLQVGDGGVSGTLGSGDVANNGALIFNRSDSYGFGGAIDGSGSVRQAGTGTTILSGGGSYAGPTTVSAGALYINGNFSAAHGLTSVASGATLGGTGIIGGDVTVADGGILSPGDVNAVGTLTINGNLALGDGAVLNYRLGQSDMAGGVLNDLTVVNGDLTLGGTINVTVPAGGVFDPGIYRIFSYGGSLTDNGLKLGALPYGNVTVQTAVAGQVNLVNAASNLAFWDGGNAALAGNGLIDGGSGVWNSGPGANGNWADSTGAANGPYASGSYAIFDGRPGTVTVDDSLGQVVASGMQFAVDGYRLEGGPVTLIDNSGAATGTASIRVGDGTDAATGYTAAIASVLQGDARLAKTGRGTLVLTGDNTYTGGTSIVLGTLQLGDGGTSGAIVGDVTNFGALAFNRSDSYTFGGAISGVGSLAQNGTGTTILTGDSTYSGGTIISSGMLQIGGGGVTGSVTGDIVNNVALAFNRSNSYAYGGSISGTGSVAQNGTGTTILTGTNTYTGGTVISAGTLQLGDGGGTGSLLGDVAVGGNLAFNRNNTYTFGGLISGTGSVTQSGGGKTVLTGANTYTGGTYLDGGAVQVTSDDNLGGASGNLVFNGGSLQVNASFASARGIVVNGASGGINTAGGATFTASGAVSGTGTLGIGGSGTVILTGDNTHTGGISVYDGTLQVAGDNNLGASSGLLTLGNATLHTTGSFTSDRAIALMPVSYYSSDNNVTFNVDDGTTLHLAGDISGNADPGRAYRAAKLVKTGTGTLILSGNNTYGSGYTSGTTVQEGILQVGDGGGSGTLGVDTADPFGTINIAAGAGLVFNRNNTFLLSAPIAGAGWVAQTGTGTTILANNETYTGGTTIAAGTLQLGNGGTSGLVAGDIANDGTLAFNRSDAFAYGGVISGSGNVRQIGSGTLILDGVNSYGGGTEIVSGTVQVSSDANLGAASGALGLAGGTLATIADMTMARATTLTGNGIFDVASGTTLTMNGAVGGTGGLTKTNSGTLVLNGDSAYTGSTTVSAGALYVNGDLSAATGAMFVSAGGRLGGTGIIGGDVVIGDGAALAPGAQDGGGTLTVNGSLTLSNTSSLDYQFGEVNGVMQNSLTNVNGDLTVNGRLNVTIPVGGTFDPGIYRVFNYSGTLTDNGLVMGSVPAGSSLHLQMRVPNQVNMVNTTGQVMVFWDGNASHDFNNGQIEGGSGVWRTFTGAISSWTDYMGDTNAMYQNQAFAIFQGPSGTVTVDNSGGNVVSSGMQFASDGYVIDGDALTLMDTATAKPTGSTTIRVGDGSALGEGYRATISAALEGFTRLVKTDWGTLILNGVNTYTGGTAINGGTLQVSSDGNLGDASGALNLDGGTLAASAGFTTARAVTVQAKGGTIDVMNGGDALTMSGAIDGAGALSKTGNGRLVLTGVNSYAGGTAINGGTLQVSSDGNLGDASGALSLDGGTLAASAGFATARAVTLQAKGGTIDVMNGGDTLTMSGIIDGAGALSKTGGGRLVLTGANSYAGGTAISGGTLQVGDGGAAGTLGAGDVANDGVLAFRRSDAYRFDGAIAGTGSVLQSGTGTLTLGGASTYSGGTTIASGAVIATGGSALGTGLVTVDTALQLDFATGQTFANRLAGAGAVEVTGSGLATITGANSAFTGNWRVTGHAALDTASAASSANLGSGAVDIAAGGVLDAKTGGAFTFDNALTGTGTLHAANGGRAFAFGSGVGSAFAGNLALADSTFDLSGDNAAALANAQLTIGSGATVTIGGGGTQTIDGLAFDGGTLVFDLAIPAQAQGPAPMEVTGTAHALDLSGAGNVRINFTASNDVPAPPASTGGGLMEQDDANVLMQLIRSGGAVIGSGANLTLVDADGNPVSNGLSVDIEQGGGKVAEGTYDYKLTTGAANDGLYVNYGLTEINLIGTGAGALALTAAPGATGNAADLSARVSGSGDLAISAGAGNVITLSNSANSYSGRTDIRSGTLKMAADNVLGKTAAVTIAGGAAFDTGGYSQGIGALTTAAGSAVTIAAGSTLTITDAQRTAGETDGGALERDTLFGGGALVIDPSIMRVNGTQAGFAGLVTVTGGSALIVNTAGVFDNAQGVRLATAGDVLTFGDLSSYDSAWTGIATGAAAMNISGLGTVNLTDGADIALTGDNSGFAGAFVIDAASTLRADAGKGLGTAALRLDGTFHAVADADWRIAGAVSGAGTLVKTGAAALAAGNTLAGFTGLADIRAGTLRIGDAATGDGLIGGRAAVAAGATLTGRGMIAGNVENAGTIAALNAAADYGDAPVSRLTIGGVLTNSGTVNLAGTRVGNTLTVGGIIGQGGAFVLNTVLGDDASQTDRIVIDGGFVTGSNALRILNAGGAGGQTDTGILLVQAVNGATTDAGAFTLDPQSSGFRATSSTLAIGAYDYSLVRGGHGGDANSWYLSSFDPSAGGGRAGGHGGSTVGIDGKRILRPEAGIYGMNAEMARGMFMTTLHDREGYRQKSGASELYAGWGRISGTHQNGRFGNDALGTKAGSVTAQLGLDLFHYASPNFGSFYAGVMGGWGHAETEAASRQRALAKATGSVDGYSVGAYGTWYQKERGETGAYIDAWAQYSWFHNKVMGGGLPQEKYNSHAVTASIEAGYSFLLMDSGRMKLFLEPQAQLAYISYGMDRHVENSGTNVRFRDGGGLVARVGGRLSGLIELENGAALRPFIEANYWHNQKGGKLWMNNDLVPSGAPRSFTEVKAGISADLSKNLQVFTEVSTRFGRHHYNSIGGQIGLKFRW